MNVNQISYSILVQGIGEGIDVGASAVGARGDCIGDKTKGFEDARIRQAVLAADYVDWVSQF